MNLIRLRHPPSSVTRMLVTHLIVMLVLIAGCPRVSTPTAPVAPSDPATTGNDQNTGPAPTTPADETPSHPAPNEGDLSPGAEPTDTDPNNPAVADTQPGCIVCHALAQGDRRAVATLSGASAHLGTVTDAICQNCHEMTRHRSGVIRLWGSVAVKSVVLSISNDADAPTDLTAFCGNCHANTGDFRHPSDGRITCNSCHDVHAPLRGNLALIRQSVLNPTGRGTTKVVFTARSGVGSFDDGDPAANDGVCQVCHTGTVFHRYDGSGIAHFAGADCASCHSHADGFISGAGSCIACHSTPQGTRLAVVAADGGGGHHLDEAVLSDDDCLVCHDTSAHQEGVVRVWSDPTNPTAALPLTGEAAELVSFCDACHSALTHPTIHTVGADWEPVCTECHELHDPQNANLALVRDVIHNQTLSADRPVVFTARTGGGSFDDGDPAANDGVCQVCHTGTVFHRYDGSGIAHFAGADCASCHAHADGFISAAGSCIACHSTPQGTRLAVVAADGGGGHHLDEAVLSDDDCLVCHDTSAHQEGVVRVWSDPTNPTAALPLTGDSAELVPFCDACHSALTHPTIHTVGADWEPVCTECHELHDPQNANLALVRDVIHNQTLSADRPVVFTARTGTGSFDDGDPAANDGVCQVCHTGTVFHRYDGSGIAHFAGADCASCHAHADGFISAAGSCIACHSTPQGTRLAVVAADGSGGHHLDEAVLSDDDCLVCHDTSAHQEGIVRVWSDPTNPTAALPLTGEAAELVSFCDACHSALTHPTIHTVGADWEPVCTECHELHDPQNANLALVRDVIHNQTLSADRPVVFTARTGTGSFDDGDPAANDGVCQVCHTGTVFHRYDGSGIAHFAGADCASCHAHADGFISAAGSCIACHSTPQGTRLAVVAADGSGGHHLDEAVLSDDDCLVCHDTSAHQEGIVRVWSDPTNPTAALPLTGEAAELVSFCDACHSALTHPTIHTVGADWEPVCTECHELHDPQNANLALVRDVIRNQTLSTDRPVVFTARSGVGSFDDGDPTANDGVCQVCHTGTVFHRYDGSGIAHFAGADCASCHAHADGFISAAGSCIACHSTPQGTRLAVVAADGGGGHHLDEAVLSDDDCLVCHDTSAHQEGVVRVWSDPTNPTAALPLTGEAAELVPFCDACHSALTHPTIHTVGADWEPVCTECHELHDPQNANLALVRDVIHNQTLSTDRPVVFTARTGTGSFDDGDPTANDGVCQVCHTDTVFHVYDGSGSAHFDGQDCTSCHSHQTHFLLSLSSCRDCHTTMQDDGDGVPPDGRRAVLADFARASHHVSASIADEDCLVCHEMSRHGRGHVRLIDPDDGVTVYVHDQLDADELTPFCLHCHDANGATAGNWNQPFSDGATVPDIDQSGRWATSAHATGGTTNPGQGCTDCHGNGHGSNLRHLLLPADGSPGTDNTNEEEGFCLACHSTGVVVNEAVSNGWFGGVYADFTNDIAATLGQHASHPVVDSADGHVFDLGLGPQELECTSCHSVHQDSGKYWAAPNGKTPVTRWGSGELWGDDAGEKVGQFDPTGIYQAPAIGEAGSNLSGDPLPIGFDDESLLTADVLPDYNAFCLTCHQHAFNGLLAIDWASEKHGAAAAEPDGPAGAELAAPYDSAERGHYFLACVDCHETHGSENNWLLRRSANGDVVSTLLAPDTTNNWGDLCGRCHLTSLLNTHHNSDVWRNKLGMPPGSPDCQRCHEPVPEVSCMTSGCHNHNEFF